MAIEGLSARLYLDQNADPRIAITLRGHGYDVVVAHDVGMSRASDEEHLEFASALGRVLFTYDLDDFPVIAAMWYAQGRTHSGIIIAKQTNVTPYGLLIRRLLVLLDELSAEQFINLVRWA